MHFSPNFAPNMHYNAVFRAHGVVIVDGARFAAAPRRLNDGVVFADIVRIAAALRRIKDAAAPRHFTDVTFSVDFAPSKNSGLSTINSRLSFIVFRAQQI
jgi:hypothetical protein